VFIGGSNAFFFAVDLFSRVNSLADDFDMPPPLLFDK
jgi:hypothetical protein